MFCAPRRRFESRICLDTSHNAVNGGQTTISTSFTLANSRLRSHTKSTASATVLFIFQLPAMMSLRSLSIFSNRPRSSSSNTFDYERDEEDEDEITCQSAPPHQAIPCLPGIPGSP